MFETCSLTSTQLAFATPMMASRTASEPTTGLRHHVPWKTREGRDEPNTQLAFADAALLVNLLPSYATDKINGGTSALKAGGPNIWPGALREGLWQPDLGLLADLAMTRSVFVTRTTSWQLPGILHTPPIVNAVFVSILGPKVEMGRCDVTKDVTDGFGPSVTTIPHYCNFIVTQWIIQLPFDGLFNHFHMLKKKSRNFRRRCWLEGLDVFRKFGH